MDLTPDNNSQDSYTFLVAGDMAEVDRQTSEFNTTLFWSFLLLGVGLISAILVQVKIGLLPLKRVSEGLSRIRDGKARRLEGRFPAEIAPLAGELNSLIEHSEEVVGRARTHVSNLAHFLKTPLSVLAAEADAHEKDSGADVLAEMVKRQVFSMRRQVDHYLSRARAAGSLDVLGNRTQVAAGAGGSLPRDRAHPCRAWRHGGCGLRRRTLFPRRTAGPGRDAGQSDRQCLQMGQDQGPGPV